MLGAAALGLALIVAAAGCSGGPGVTVDRDVPFATPPGADAPLQLDVFRPGDAPPPAGRPAVLLVHGGAFVAGDRTQLEDYARAFADEGMVAATVSYRLSDARGEAWFPAVSLTDSDLRAAAAKATADVLAAVDWMRSSAARLGVDPGRIHLFGYSAGAIASLDAALTTPGAAGDVAGVVAVAGGVTDPDAVLPGAPPALLVHGDLDETVNPILATQTCAAAAADDDVCTIRWFASAGHDVISTERERIVAMTTAFVTGSPVPDTAGA